MAKVLELIKTVQQIINCGNVQNASVSFDCQSDRLRLRIELQEFALNAGNKEGIVISKGLFYLDDLNFELPPAQMIKEATVRVESLVVRLAVGLFNRALASDKVQQALVNLPVDIRDLNFALSGKLMTLSGSVRKGLTFGFAVDLKPYVKGNNICVAFESFYLSNLLPMPGSLRRMLMSVVNQKLMSNPDMKGLVSIDGDVITVNPWKKIPVKVKADILRFGVEGHCLVLVLGASHRRDADDQMALSDNNSEAVSKADRKPIASKSESKRPAPVRAAVADRKLVMPESGNDGEMVLPFV